ncbi:MAG: folate-binding protein YgfZ [Candidatus Solibacter usitatus]|nr:folate-binding protein YgfZ [Candidatus Solibacter usitatus]
MSPGYRALREGAARLDLDARGRFRVLGEDRVRLLHAMTTNHIEQLKPGESCYAFFLSTQGRILGDVNILCLEDCFLLDTEPALHDALFAHLDKYIIADDVVLEDARMDHTAIGVEGPSAPAALKNFSACKAPFTTTGAEGARLFVKREERDGVIAQLRELGVVEAAAEDQEIVRLEHFRPRYGADITEKNLVHETQMLNAIHFSKGCYIGQEIVERVRSRGQVHRLLVPLYLDSAEPPSKGTAVTSAGVAAGEITSAAFSPALGKCVAFAYLKGEHAKPETAITVGESQGIVAAAKGA